MKRVIVCEPDAQLAVRYEREAARLADALGKPDWTIDHIGSTSVPGLAAKPIVDMLLQVTTLAELDASAAQITALGYVGKGEYGIAGRRYFTLGDQPAGMRSVHLHAFVCGHAAARAHLTFRDYLRSHPESALAYGQLKRQLAARFPMDITAYMDGKAGMIQQILTDAARQ